MQGEATGWSSREVDVVWNYVTENLGDFGFWNISFTQKEYNIHETDKSSGGRGVLECTFGQLTNICLYGAVSDFISLKPVWPAVHELLKLRIAV